MRRKWHNPSTHTQTHHVMHKTEKYQIGRHFQWNVDDINKCGGGDDDDKCKIISSIREKTNRKKTEKRNSKIEFYVACGLDTFSYYFLLLFRFCLQLFSPAFSVWNFHLEMGKPNQQQNQLKRENGGDEKSEYIKIQSTYSFAIHSHTVKWWRVPVLVLYIERDKKRTKKRKKQTFCCQLEGNELSWVELES